MLSMSEGAGPVFDHAAPPGQELQDRACLAGMWGLPGLGWRGERQHPEVLAQLRLVCDLGPVEDQAAQPEGGHALQDGIKAVPECCGLHGLSRLQDARRRAPPESFKTAGCVFTNA